MWTIRIHGEADDLFDAVLQTVPQGYVVRIEHAGFTGEAVFVATAARSITVRPHDSETGHTGEPVELDWADLDSVEVY